MAFTGAILGHANPRSTAIYAHVQHSPARRAADRVAERIAAALAGMSDLEVDAPAADEDEELLRRVAETLLKGGAEADRLRVVINADRKSVVKGKSVSVRVDLGGRRII